MDIGYDYTYNCITDIGYNNKRHLIVGAFPVQKVGVTRFELATPWSQTRYATNCATPRLRCKVTILF